MGMFDYIRTKMPLPADPAPPEGVEWFQTKETPTYQLWLDKWTIEADGRLVKHAYRIEDHSDPNAETAFERVIGCMTRIDEPEKDETIPFHGDIGFGHYDSKTGEDWNYVARFTEGRCVRIWHVPPKASGPI